VILRLYFFLLLSACGELAPQLVEGVSYELRQDTVKLSVDLHAALALTDAQSIPLKEYGSLQLLPRSASSKGSTMVISIEQSAMSATNALYLDQTTSLPNHQQIPRFSALEMRTVKNKISRDLTGYMFFTMDTRKRYVGAAVELSYFAESLPAELVVVQKLRTMAGEEIGVVALYGPSKDSTGGIFVLCDLDGLVKMGAQQESDRAKQLTQNFTLYHGLLPVEESAANQSTYGEGLNLSALLNKIKADGKTAGLGE
jgi:hypothetical protein